ncbi:hypothetical protein D3C85_1726100 [compost metagenome]
MGDLEQVTTILGHDQIGRLQRLDESRLLVLWVKLGVPLGRLAGFPLSDHQGQQLVRVVDVSEAAGFTPAITHCAPLTDVLIVDRGHGVNSTL